MAALLRLPLSFRSGAWVRLGLVARWVLVLALAWDQAGSPLHHHHHASGVDAHGSFGAPHAHEEAETLNRDASYAHGVLAMRPQFNATATTPALQAAILPIAAQPSLAVAADDALPATDAGPPGYASYRSLPPAGRAPPLHA